MRGNPDRLHPAIISCTARTLSVHRHQKNLNSWADRQINPSLGQCRFSFVLIADTHVDRENLPSSSPFAINQLCNARTRCAVKDIRRLLQDMGSLAPRFVLHLGDLTHPVPSMPAYQKAVEDFREITDQLELPLYLIPGNHDVGDKPVSWAPAGVVCEEYLSKWDQHFGDQYQSFSIEDVTFVLINAQIINSGLTIEKRQRKWLEQILRDSDGERIMLFSHYPPFLNSPDEQEHYDNLAEPGRSWILELIQRYRLEAMFTGHVHHFWYQRYESADCYLLPSTSFTRQDYSEMFRAAPTNEMQDGRNDIAKIGYFLVLVYQNGHVCHFRSTLGRELPGQTSLNSDDPSKCIVAYHPREMVRYPVGFDMRHAWNEVTEIAPSGALDEFHRKAVRNDYPLLSLWQMGIGLMRVPAQDLDSADTLARMRTLKHSNHEFVVTSEAPLSAKTCASLIRNQDIIKRLDLTLSIENLACSAAVIHELKEKVSFPIYLSKLRMKSDFVNEGEPYYHRISFGFSVNDENDIHSLLSDSQYARLFDGIVFRISRTDQVSQLMHRISDIGRRLKIHTSTTLFMADHNPAVHSVDDQANANRIAEGFFAAAALENIDIFIDTFMDHDRGHCVRNGVIDRICNPRDAMFVVRNLGAILTSAADFSDQFEIGESDHPTGKWLCSIRENRLYQLILPSNPSGPHTEMLLNDHHVTDAEAVGLVCGSIVPCSIHHSGKGTRLVFEKALSGPLFVRSQLRDNTHA